MYMGSRYGRWSTAGSKGTDGPRSMCGGDGDGTQEEKVDKTEKKEKGLMLAMVTGWRG